jgi:hypothetical protein
MMLIVEEANGSFIEANLVAAIFPSIDGERVCMCVEEECLVRS